MRRLSGPDALFRYSDRPGRHRHLSTPYHYEASSARDCETRPEAAGST
jgi:hypothetical protein